jgi:hypothetical protein
VITKKLTFIDFLNLSKLFTREQTLRVYFYFVVVVVVVVVVLVLVRIAISQIKAF